MSGPVPHRYRKLRITEISGVDEGASPGARVTFWKRRDGVEKSTMNLDEILSKLPEEQRNVILAAVEAAQKAGMEAAKAEMQAKPPEAETPKIEVEMKAPDAPAPEAPKAPVEAEKKDAPMPEEIKKRLEAERAEVTKAKAERDAFAKKLAEIEDRDEQREYVAKAKTMPLPGLIEDELGTILRSVAKGRAVPAALATKLEAVIKGASEALAKSKLLDENGAPGGADDGAPLAKLEAIAKSLKAADPQLSSAAAIAKAYELNPSLYAEARKQPTA